MGIEAIPDGSLTAEMNRGEMALHYNLYALAPLIMLAELGLANGIDLYAYDDGAIHRPVKFCLAGRSDNPRKAHPGEAGRVAAVRGWRYRLGGAVSSPLSECEAFRTGCSGAVGTVHDLGWGAAGLRFCVQ